MATGKEREEGGKVALAVANSITVRAGRATAAAAAAPNTGTGYRKHRRVELNACNNTELRVNAQKSSR